VHRVEIGEGNTQKKQKGEPTTASIGKVFVPTTSRDGRAAGGRRTPDSTAGIWSAQMQARKPHNDTQEI
jgi:hypothetical protein